MARFLINPLYYDPGVPFSGIVPVSLGGTGQSTVSDVLSSFGFLDRTKANAANGYVRLVDGSIPVSVIPTGANGVALTDSNNLIPESAFGTIVVGGVTLVGPLSVVVGQMVTYTITNYDAFTTYNVSASAGSISIADATIAYTAPSSAGSVTITINGRSATLDVVASVVNTPKITAPINGATGISRKPTFTKSSFSVTGQAQTQTGVRWELSTDPAFTTLVDYYEGTSNYTSWMPSVTLSNLTTYYVRVKDQGSISGYSAWSPVVGFTTVQQVNFVTTLGDNKKGAFYDIVKLNGHLYVVGRQGVQGQGGADALVCKYDTNGNLLWQRCIGGSGDDVFNAITTDGTYLYAVGFLLTQNQNSILYADALIVKYDQSGNLIWQRSLGSSAEDQFRGVVCKDSYIYVVGTQSAGGIYLDTLIAKYDTNGNLIWQKSVAGNGNDQLTGIITLGNYLYVAGWQSNSNGSNYDNYIAKYDTDGNLIWQRILDISPVDSIKGITTDGTNLYITGFECSRGITQYRGVIIKYDTNGNLIWQRVLGGNLDTGFWRVTSDGTYVYAVGSQNSQSQGDYDALIVKYDANGNLIWQRSLGGSSGDIFISGITDGVYVYAVGSTSFPVNQTTVDYPNKNITAIPMLAALPVSGSITTGALVGSGLTGLSWTQPTLTSSSITVTVTTPSFSLYTPSTVAYTPTLTSYTPTLPTLYSTF